MGDVKLVKVYVDDMVLAGESLAKDLKIPFDGVIYAGIVAIDKKDKIPPGELRSGIAERTRTIRLSEYSYNILHQFAINRDITDEGAVNQIIKYLLRNPHIVQPYYHTRIDVTSPKKISKSDYQ